MSDSIIEKEIVQGAVPIGTPKAYQYDAALVEAAKATVQQGRTDIQNLAGAAVQEAEAIATALTDIYNEAIAQGTVVAPAIDKTSTITGAAADAQVVGDNIRSLDSSTFADTYYELNKTSEDFTIEDGYYATSYGKQPLSGYRLCYMVAQRDFQFYIDSTDALTLIVSIYNNGVISSANFDRIYSTSRENLPDVDHKQKVLAGQVLAISVHTGDFVCKADYKKELLNNAVVLNANQVNQVLNSIDPPLNSVFGNYQLYELLTKNSDVFTVEDGYYAVNGGKVALSGYKLLYFTAQKNFDLYCDTNTLTSATALIISVYNTAIASGNNVYYLRSSNGTLPTSSNKASVTKGQILAISIYTPPSAPHDFGIYANYRPYWQLTNSVYLNDTQLNQVAGSASFNNFARSKKIAWFGDSISEMRQLPHTTGTLLSATVYDCSFRGSTIGRTYSNYNEFSFSHLVTSIVAGDFSAQWTQLEAEEQSQGRSLPWLRENLTTLESLDFSQIDYVVLLQGTNDFAIPINARAPYTTRVAEMQGYMDNAIGQLISFAPQIKFYIFSPFYRGDITEDNYHNTIADYVNAQQVVAKKYAIPFDNLLLNSRICEQNQTTYLNSADLVHPNVYGDNYLAEICAKFIGTH